MKMHHENRITISLSGDDPWQTERRSSDYIIGDMPRDEVETTQLALVPIESLERPAGIPGSIVTSLLAQHPVHFSSSNGWGRASRPPT
jgi:hypothetical protein